MKYEKFKEILNNKIFENSKSDLIKKIADNPDRYIGLFRPTKPKGKILQNLLQSNEIKFGDSLEYLFREYFNEVGYTNLDRMLYIDGTTREYLDLDQLFTDGKYVYFIEQKVRDDHDSTKKRGQIENFEKKIIALLKTYKETKIKSYNYFIDPSLIKNKNFYISEIEKIKHDYNIYSKLCYGDEFWIDINHKNIWNEILHYLQMWKEEIPDMPSINFDENAYNTFQEIKNISTITYRKLFENKDVCKEILPILFPHNETLRLLLDFFKSLSIEQSIYRNLAEKISMYLYNKY